MWGLGGFTDAMIFYGVFSLVNTIYVNARGVNAVLVGLACAVSRLLDSFSDPVVGHLSDNTRSRWGRRRPWMLAGILICAAVTLLLWGAPAAESSRSAAAVGAQESWWASAGRAIGAGWGTFLYLAGMITLLLAVGYTLFTIPHYAMGYEMTTDYDERTHLFKWRFVLFAAAGFLTPWLMPLCMWFEGDRAQVLRGSEGVFPVAAIAAVIILATGIPSLFCKEKVIRERGPRVRFLAAARLTFGNRPFLLLLASNFVARFGMAITGVFFYYVFVYHIGRGEQLAGAALLAVFFNTINAANFLAMAPIASLAGRIGKKPALLLLLAMSAVAYASLVFTFTSGDESFLRSGLGGSSWTLFVHWPTIVTAVLIGVFTNTMPMITNSMIADVCDYDELTSGSRREGFYGAVYTSTEKIAWSVSFAFQGILLVASGFDASLAQQAPETIRYWILALVITQPTGFLIGVVILLFYPLSRARVGEIRAALEARGGVNGVH
jgi:GPH family glycoside/pentoside/hexuronide:cation symporter